MRLERNGDDPEQTANANDREDNRSPGVQGNGQAGNGCEDSGESDPAPGVPGRWLQPDERVGRVALEHCYADVRDEQTEQREFDRGTAPEDGREEDGDEGN